MLRSPWLHDIYLMEHFKRHGNHTKDMEALNCYHLYLKVIRLSNIMSANIRYIILLVIPLLIGLVLFFGQNKDTHHPQIGSLLSGISGNKWSPCNPSRRMGCSYSSPLALPPGSIIELCVLQWCRSFQCVSSSINLGKKSMLWTVVWLPSTFQSTDCTYRICPIYHQNPIMGRWFSIPDWG
jgi:hypothetical protein